MSTSIDHGPPQAPNRGKYARRFSLYFIILAFLFMALAGILFHGAANRWLSIGPWSAHNRVAGMFFITVGVCAYFVGRVLGVVFKIKNHRDPG
jgi:hypothetical protein